MSTTEYVARTVDCAHVHSTVDITMLYVRVNNAYGLQSAEDGKRYYSVGVDKGSELNCAQGSTGVGGARARPSSWCGMTPKDLR